jgi:hypothetical protein
MPAQIALAWLLAQKPWIVPIPGTRRLQRLDENIGAVAVELTSNDLREIHGAASKIEVQGASAAALRGLVREGMLPALVDFGKHSERLGSLSKAELPLKIKWRAKCQNETAASHLPEMHTDVCLQGVNRKIGLYVAISGRQHHHGLWRESVLYLRDTWR